MSSSASSRRTNSFVSTENYVCIPAFTSTYSESLQTPRHLVVTLDPNRFSEKKQQHLHIGNLLGFRPHIMLANQSRPVVSPLLRYDTAMTGMMFYPPDTKGFLYYFPSPKKTRISGELRFRVASSDDPASFESGSDLMMINGQAWSRPLCVVSKYYIPLYEKLREELFVPDELDAALSTFPRKYCNFRQSQLLYTLNDTFIVNLSSPKQILTVVTEQGIESLRLDSLFMETRDGAKLFPYTGESPSLDFPRLMTLNEFVGSALFRFERSTLPDHKGTRTVVLRFLKIITPVKCLIPNYDGSIVQPEEGELYQRIPRGKTVPIARSVNIDRKTSFIAHSLQLLWDV